MARQSVLMLGSCRWLAKRAENKQMAGVVSPLYTLVFFLCRLIALPYYTIHIGVRALLGTALK
jgi:FtsH-binding integral membrane protein